MVPTEFIFGKKTIYFEIIVYLFIYNCFKNFEFVESNKIGDDDSQPSGYHLFMDWNNFW